MDELLIRLMTALDVSEGNDYRDRVTQVRQMFGDTAAANLIQSIAKQHGIDLAEQETD